MACHGQTIGNGRSLMAVAARVQHLRLGKQFLGSVLPRPAFFGGRAGACCEWNERRPQNLRVADDELATGDSVGRGDGLPSPSRRVLIRMLRFRLSAFVRAVRLGSSDPSVISVIARPALSISSETAKSRKRCAALATRPLRSERLPSLAEADG
jgi:hypothetical protein